MLYKNNLLLPLLIVTASLNCGAAFGQIDSTKIFNLDKCIKTTLKKNVLLDDARKDVELSQAKYLKKAHANLLPQFELINVWGLSPEKRGETNPYGYLTSPDDPDELKNLSYLTQTEVKFSQPIYSFNRYARLSAAAQHELNAEEADYLKQKNELRFQVEQLYWGLVLGKESQRVILDVQEKLSEIEKKLKEQLEAGTGEANQTDLFKLEISKYEINKRSREAETKIEIARSTLAMALGLSASDSFQIETEYLEAVNFELNGIEEYVNIAMRYNPEIIKAREKLYKQNMILLAERSLFYPQFYFGGTVTHNFAAGRFDPNNPFVNNNTNFLRANLGIGFRQKLNFLTVKDDIEIALAKSELAESKAENIERELGTRIEGIHAKIKKAQDKLRAGRRALRASRGWLNSASMTFDIGMGDIKNLTDAYQANSAMKIENFQNIFEFNTAVAELKMLIVETH